MLVDFLPKIRDQRIPVFELIGLRLAADVFVIVSYRPPLTRPGTFSYRMRVIKTDQALTFRV